MTSPIDDHVISEHISTLSEPSLHLLEPLSRLFPSAHSSSTFPLPIPTSNPADPQIIIR